YLEVVLMLLIDPQDVQTRLDRLKDRDIYVHLETTSGAYAVHNDSSKHPSSAFISNAKVRFSHGSIATGETYRVGLKLDQGWIYAEGLTHYEETETERLLLAGHDKQGKLVVALQ